jgi:hypothetical protein
VTSHLSRKWCASGWSSLFSCRAGAVGGRLQALELTLDDMADRVAQAELEAMRQACHARQCEARAVAAESALLQLRNSSGHLRQYATA